MATDIFTVKPYQFNSSATSQYQPNLIEQMAGKSFITPFQVTPKSQVVGTNVGTSVTQTNTSKAPIVTANTSDVQAQIESIKAQIAEKQKQVDEMKANEAKASEAPAQQSATEKIWTSLMGKQSEIQSQVAASQQKLLDQQNAIYEQWGLTPEKYQRINDITAQITEYQKQMADLDTQEQNALATVEGRTGTTLDYMNAESNRISRAFAVKKSGVAAQASVLASEAQALQGNWDNAFKSAQLYVDNATKAQQQVVSDLKWGFENYKDIITSMTEDEQKRINDQLDYQTALLKQQSDDYWNQIAADQRQQGINIDYMKLQQSGAGSSDIQSNIDYYINQVTSRNLDLSTPTLPSDTRKAIVSAMAERGISIPKPLTAKQKNAADDATSGLDAVQQLRAMAESGTLPLARTQFLGEGLLGRISGASQFITLKKEATDIKTRIRTGAALNESEIKFYASQAPAYGDSPEDVKKKLDQLEGFYLGMSGLPVTVEDSNGNQYQFNDLYNPQQRLGLKQAISSGYKLSY